PPPIPAGPAVAAGPGSGRHAAGAVGGDIAARSTSAAVAAIPGSGQGVAASPTDPAVLAREAGPAGSAVAAVAHQRPAVTAHAASPTVGPGAAHAAIAVLAGVAAGTALAKSVGGAV